MKHPSIREPGFSQTVGGEPPDKIEKMPMREALSRYKSFNQSPAQMVFDDLERRRIHKRINERVMHSQNKFPQTPVGFHIQHFQAKTPHPRETLLIIDDKRRNRYLESADPKRLR